LDGQEFEEIIAAIFKGAGWRTELTPPTGDYGIDVICRKRYPIYRKYPIQARYKSEVDSKVGLGEAGYYNSIYDQGKIWIK
jgi:HJR/Mrr/RecB family endonuclease